MMGFTDLILNWFKKEKRPEITEGVNSEAELTLRGKIAGIWSWQTATEQELRVWNWNKLLKERGVSKTETLEDALKYCDKAIELNPAGKYQKWMKKRITKYIKTGIDDHV